MRPYYRVRRFEKKHARRFGHATTAKKRSAFRGGHEPPRKRIKNQKMRLVKDEQVAGPSTSRGTLPIATTSKGSRHLPSANPATSREQMGKRAMSKRQYVMLKNRFADFARCLMLVWWHACLHSKSFFNHVFTWPMLTREYMTTYDFLCKATQVTVNEGIAAGFLYCDGLARRELGLVHTSHVQGPSELIQKWQIFYFAYKKESFITALKDAKLNIGQNRFFNGKQIMFWLERGSARNDMIRVNEFPKSLTVTNDPVTNAEKIEVQLQFQGITFANCSDYSLSVSSPELIETFSVVGIQLRTRPPIAIYFLHDSKGSVPEVIPADYSIPCDEGLLVLYTI